MESLFTKKVPLYFETEESQLIFGDCFKILTEMKPESVDMIFADPPYFLSNDGITCQGGKMVSVNKGSWDKLSESGTSVEEKHKFNRKWIKLCKKVLKPNGTIWTEVYWNRCERKILGDIQEEIGEGLRRCERILKYLMRR